MAEEKYVVNTYEIDFKCDVCGSGWYRPTGEVYPTYPMKFPHRCNYCGAEMIVEEHTYPYTITVKEIEEEVNLMYKYGMRLRGFAPGCQPMIGLVRREDDPTGKYYDILIYSRPLNDQEQDVFELDYLGEVKE